MIDQENSARNIIGIGVDLLEIERFKKVYMKNTQAFKKRIFTDTEISYCETYSDPLLHYAARFCAKEAVSKALGTGIGKHLSFLDIQIASQDNRKPLLCLLGQAKLYFDNPVFDISLSHTDSMATAFVIAYRATVS